jgi:Icc-related predicted phosphoesterase
MMKVSVASDLHLEFGDLNIQNDHDSDLLILSGDICIARDVTDHNHKSKSIFNRFFERCAEEFQTVIYVLGNHEHYHGDFATTAQDLKRKLSYLNNLHILDHDTIKVQDVMFIGGTLWTDMNGKDPITLLHLKNAMNDFRVVANSNRTVSFRSQNQSDGSVRFHEKAARFDPEDTVLEFEKFVTFISKVIDSEPNGKFVVCGHHAPSLKSIHPKYAHDFRMNGAYSSDLSDFILDHPQICLWTHGHTHDSFDYMIGSTRVICNPRGYVGYEASAAKWQLVTVDI